MLTFKKTERLCSKKLISDLYNIGNQLYYYPFKVLWCVPDTALDKTNAQVLICVSKKTIPDAAKRNLIKRQIRESYRKNKKDYLEYLNNSEKQNLLLFNYTEKKILTYKEIETKIILILHRLLAENENNNH